MESVEKLLDEEQSTPFGHGSHVHSSLLSLWSLRYCTFGSQSSANFHAGLSHALCSTFGVLPAAHNEHAVEPRRSLYFPMGQSAHSSVPGAAAPNLPKSQPEQTELAAGEYSPVEHSRHLSASSSGPRYSPSTQSLHGVPALPGIHVVHVALLLIDDLPMAQLKHLSASSSGPRYSPSTQSLHGVPALPGMHVVHVALPLMDDLPMTHSRHASG